MIGHVGIPFSIGFAPDVAIDDAGIFFGELYIYLGCPVILCFLRYRKELSERGHRIP